MKILWVKSDFLHPTSRGGQIRTLETIRRLHQKHEVHYMAFENPAEPEGVARAKEYCSYVYPVKHEPPRKRSLAFALQVAGSVFSSLPVAVARWTSPAMKQALGDIQSRQKFDAVVCDFLHPAANFDSLAGCVLFQHNVETMIWRRHTEHAGDPLQRAYFELQAKRLFEFEKKACLEAGRVIAVSEADSRMMRDMFGARDIVSVPTGVDIDYFRRPEDTAPPATDLVFVGSMDWMPNTDGVHYFVREILPLIRRRYPECSVTVVGRKPSPDILALGEADPRIRITGTVPDVRPFLWDAKVSIVPLRIGGGTRLKIYEAMAAGVPTVSTTVGAEGLDIAHPSNIRLADTPETFAADCIAMLSDRREASRMSAEALHLVTSRFSWDRITQDFENILAGVAERKPSTMKITNQRAGDRG
jgi:glycosyltransferase involved in cell wall biosynthesis